MLVSGNHEAVPRRLPGSSRTALIVQASSLRSVTMPMHLQFPDVG